MDIGTINGFQHHDSLPYEIESRDEAMSELEDIVLSLESLFKANKFQLHVFGADYAPEVAIVTKALMAWQKKKHKIPLETRVRLTKVYAQACFEATEPTLMVRYGLSCLSLWKNRAAKQELRKVKNLVDWKDLVTLVRNVVILRSIKSTELGSGGQIDGLGNSLGLGGQSSSRSSSQKQPSSQLAVALNFANLFRCTAIINDETVPFLQSEILSYLGPDGHDPTPLVVVEAFTSLVPYTDPKAASIFLPIFFDLWEKVSPNVVALSLLPALAEFAENDTLNGRACSFSQPQLNLCFQAALQSMQIPLVSTQNSSSLKLAGKGSVLMGGSSTGRSLKSMSATKSSVNVKPFGTNTTAFSKLVVWSLSPENQHALTLLDSLVSAVQSFCHPSNVGHWTALIFTVLMDIVNSYVERIHLEKEYNVPQHLWLTPKMTERIASILKEPVFLGIHSQAPYVFASALETLWGITSLAPEQTIPSLLGEIYPTLQHGLHQPHRLLSSLACLARIAVPMASSPLYKMHLTTLLELSLPNIDPNESKRCLLTLALFQAVASVVVFTDESDDVNIALASQCLPECVHSLEEQKKIPAELEQDEGLAIKISRGTSAAYPEILRLYMERIFSLLETTNEARFGSAASASVLRVLLACSPNIFRRLLDLALQEIVNPQQLSNDSLAQVCGSFVRANSREAFGPIWKLLFLNIKEEILENQAGSGRTLMPKDNALLRYLSILNMSLLAANPESVLAVAEELRDLLRLLRLKTGVSVVYTVANTLHHAIAGLVGYSVILPDPEGNYPESIQNLSVSSATYLNLQWNVPSSGSLNLAAQLFEEHISISEVAVNNSIDGASTNVQDEDAVSNALIFTRTASGAISVAINVSPSIAEHRARVAKLIEQIHLKLSKDDIAGLREVLFVAKVWLCDVGYERTARMDAHQDTLYRFEKRSFKVPGAHVKGLPPAVLARRAQLYHHQRLAADSQYRAATEQDKRLLFEVIIDACFSSYPAVRRNAFSALYGPLKIFADQRLYAEVYEKVLITMSELLEAKEYERVCGGFTLFKYRSFGVLTVGQSPNLLKRFVELVSLSAAADHRQLSSMATSTLASLIPDTFRCGSSGTLSENFDSVRCLTDLLVSSSFTSLHWREALFRATGMLAVTQCPSFPFDARILKVYLEGALSQHPDLQVTSVLGALNMTQKAFRFGLAGYCDQESNGKAEVLVPSGAIQSTDATLFENDLSFFFKPAPLSVAAFIKSQARPTPKIDRANCRGRYNSPDTLPLWRTPRNNPAGLSLLTDEDSASLKQVALQLNTSSYWQQLFALHKVEPRAEDDKMLRPIALLFRNLTALAALDYCGSGESLKSLLHSLVLTNQTDLDDKHWHRIASEVFSGLLLSLPAIPRHESEVVITRSCQILEVAVAHLSPENVNYWSSSLSFALSNLDHRRVLPVIAMLKAAADPQTSSDGGGFRLSLRMELFTEVLAVLKWHGDTLENLLQNWPRWNHSLQTTRESCGDEISVAALTVVDLDTTLFASLFDLNVPKVNLSLMHLLLRLLQMLGGDACLNLLVSRAFLYLLECSAIRDDPEVIVLVTHVFSELASCTFSTKSLSTVVDLITECTHSAHWHQRIRLLLFMQSFFFNHLLTLTEEARLKLSVMTIEFLSDRQTEVRELAADTLSGMIRCSPAPEQQRYVELITSRFIGAVGSDFSLLERHSSVLAIGALVGAFPYSSPPPSWIPELLATIAVKAAGDSGTVGKTAKQVLGDFKKTRQDTWHIDQTVFSQNQLDDLDGVLWKNYFA